MGVPPLHTEMMKSPNQVAKVNDYCKVRELTPAEQKLFAKEIRAQKKMGFHMIVCELWLMSVPFATTKEAKPMTNKDIDRQIAWLEAHRSPRRASLKEKAE
jgi:hypothetical protein